MTTKELREKYLAFFKAKKHAVIGSASLIPENDPSALFISAGMQPLVPYLKGEKHAQGNRLANSQKCIRTGDIDEVGNNRHLTFFEMLGNWSLQDYFKRQAIEWSWEFLTSKKWLGLDARRFYISVFAGDDEAPVDQEAVDLWQEQFEKAGIEAEFSKNGQWTDENQRIFALPKEDNWWGLASGGPCGPCSEMFYDTTPEKGFEKKHFDDLVKNARFFEVWNDVFMQYDRQPDGGLVKLEKPNVDTGMGLERTVAVLNGEKEVFDIAEFQEMFKEIVELSGAKYENNPKAFRIIADHARAATFILGDRMGVAPSNLDQGYILRRLIRRAVRYGKQIGIEDAFLFKLAQVVIKQMALIYPELKENKEFVINQLVAEEEKFARTLERGLREFERMAKDKKISGMEAFLLFSTYGFPYEMTEELAEEKGVKIDKKEFDQEMEKHQELSRKGAEQKFKGGMADSSEETKKLHTATHLLQAALQKVLGDHVQQKGSNITTERLRFDFTHQEKITDEQKAEVENLVNDWIAQDLEVKCEELTYDEAKKHGAMGLFQDKYGEKVKVYTIEKVSCEMCGGPHVKRTGELGYFKIKKEESSSSGIRRIKAVLE